MQVLLNLLNSLGYEKHAVPITPKYIYKSPQFQNLSVMIYTLSPQVVGRKYN